MTIVQGTAEDRARVLSRKAHRLHAMLCDRLRNIPDDGTNREGYCETVWAIDAVSDLLIDLDELRFGPIRDRLIVHDPKQDAIRSATSILRRLLPSLD